MKPWKSWNDEVVITFLTKLQWGHGDEAVEEEQGRHGPLHESGGFNGATAMKPWKRKRLD